MKIKMIGARIRTHENGTKYCLATIRAEQYLSSTEYEIILDVEDIQLLSEQFEQISKELRGYLDVMTEGENV